MVTRNPHGSTAPDVDAKRRQLQARGLRRYKNAPEVRARRQAVWAVREHATEWARVIDLLEEGESFEKFKEDLTEALHACLRACLRPPGQRASNIQKMLKRVANLATATAPKLLELQELLDELKPFFDQDPSFRLPPLGPIAFSLSEVARTRLDQRFAPRSRRDQNRKLPPRSPPLAEAARHYAEAEALKDKGGAPKRFIAFDALIKGEEGSANGLADAYARATGSAAKVTWSEHREQYEGRFLALVEAVLPVARDIAEKAARHEIPFPKTARARGKYVYEATRRGAGRPTKRKWAKRTREP
ncbi:MAG TPA: hypothetical protein VE999_03690 [Gemmataceae bacterium]|nr:hypothetical protein [Gemmataceae bacterium]